MTNRNLQSVIDVEIRIAATPERVFRAWSEPRELERWAWGSLGSNCRASVDFRVGGRFLVSTDRPDGRRWAFSGLYTEIVQLQRLAHTVEWDAPMGYGPVEEHVAVEFVAADGATLVRFRHTGDFSAEAKRVHAEGWGNVLETLKGCLESEVG